ncbi:MAG: hypothetical protein M1828_004215 [Chrysothrix sp. TS-e1954]|nr:MAG: hypothetical protein M1828_004215 [Chrysothrix sp. TS-e1954]
MRTIFLYGIFGLTCAAPLAQTGSDDPTDPASFGGSPLPGDSTTNPLPGDPANFSNNPTSVAGNTTRGSTSGNAIDQAQNLTGKSVTQLLAGVGTANAANTVAWTSVANLSFNVTVMPCLLDSDSPLGDWTVILDSHTYLGTATLNGIRSDCVTNYDEKVLGVAQYGSPAEALRQAILNNTAAIVSEVDTFFGQYVCALPPGQKPAGSNALVPYTAGSQTGQPSTSSPGGIEIQSPSFAWTLGQFFEVGGSLGWAIGNSALRNGAFFGSINNAGNNASSTQTPSTNAIPGAMMSAVALADAINLWATKSPELDNTQALINAAAASNAAAMARVAISALTSALSAKNASASSTSPGYDPLEGLQTGASRAGQGSQTCIVPASLSTPVADLSLASDSRLHLQPAEVADEQVLQKAATC